MEPADVTRPGRPDVATGAGGNAALAALLTADPSRSQRIRHLRVFPPRSADLRPWPVWTSPTLVRALRARGLTAPYAHQVAVAETAWTGQHVAVTTATASGKSLGYLLPALTALETAHTATPHRRTASVLYLSPTKALAHDQLRSVGDLRIPGVRAAALDGDCDHGERDWIRDHATYVLTNPDMLHRSVLPRHQRWSRLLASVRYVVIDEAHRYRGVFGAHVAAVVRRLRRVLARYGADPVFVLASATMAEAATTASTLTGLTDVVAVTEDGSPHAGRTFALWEPPELVSGRPRPTATEAADLLGDLVAARVPTLAFVRSRHGAERMALAARDRVRAGPDARDPAAPVLDARVAAYRAGYLPEERRRLEQAIADGSLLGLAATNALELGVDIAGLDAVVLTGYPGSRASMWQQAGRAGRADTEALAVLVGADNPLDSYLLAHPDAVFDDGVEAVVLDPENPRVLAGHLCAAAQELPLEADEVAWLFGPRASAVLAHLVEVGMLRDRPHGVFWTRSGFAADAVDIRGDGEPTVQIVEAGTGRVLGNADGTAALRSLYEGAIYLHRGESYRVARLDLDAAVATVESAVVDYATFARSVGDVSVRREERARDCGLGRLRLGDIEVTDQVVGYVMVELGTGTVIGREPLDLPRRSMVTRATWWTWPTRWCRDALPGDPAAAAHAVEHAVRALLPLVATCDTGDVDGVSVREHPDTGELTVFLHDTISGGAGFAGRAFERAEDLIAAALELVVGCPCADGCPRCVQSPSCGRGNADLDKRGAAVLLAALARA